MSIAKTKQRARLSILLSILLLMVILMLVRLDELNRTAYAFTISFGNGYGRVFRTRLYYELPPVLQASVEVHEQQHMLDGQSYSTAVSEVRAYTAQLNDLRAKIAETKANYAKTRDPSLLRDLAYLRLFEQDTLSLLRDYQRQVK